MLKDVRISWTVKFVNIIQDFRFEKINSKEKIMKREKDKGKLNLLKEKYFCTELFYLEKEFLLLKI